MNLEMFKKMTLLEWVKNLILYAIGVGFMPLGVVLTINAHLGAGGYDALNSLLLMIIGMIVIAVVLSENGLGIGFAKIALGIVCVVIAFLLGGEIGIGTIICTFGLEPIIDIFHKRISAIVKIEVCEKNDKLSQ